MRVNCTASSQMRSWRGDAWYSSLVRCPDCGLVGDLVWVRGNDRAPFAKTRAHKAPEGVEPSEYKILPRGGEAVYEWCDDPSPVDPYARTSKCKKCGYRGAVTKYGGMRPHKIPDGS